MIRHIKCNIFESGADIICHQVNCQGVMGSGIAKQVRDKYPYVYEAYKQLCDERSPKSLLGSAHFVGTAAKYNTPFLGIFNLFGQENFGYDGRCYTNYDALLKCFENVKDSIPSTLRYRSTFGRITIAIPYLMSCHRGGGVWSVVYRMIEEVFGDSDIDILICEYNGG